MYLISKVAKADISTMKERHVPYVFAFTINPSVLFRISVAGTENNNIEFLSGLFHLFSNGGVVNFYSGTSKNVCPPADMYDGFLPVSYRVEEDLQSISGLPNNC
jgi:hypothetical protein